MTCNEVNRLFGLNLTFSFVAPSHASSITYFFRHMAVTFTFRVFSQFCQNIGETLQSLVYARVPLQIGDTPAVCHSCPAAGLRMHGPDR